MDKEPKVISTAPAEKSLVVPSGDMQVDDLRANIAKAREQAALTINEIERRLSFGHIKEQVKDKAQQMLTIGKVNNMANQTGETSKRWASSVAETIKDHPLPSIMIGGGLAWLIASGMSSGGSEELSDFDERRKTQGVDNTGTYGMGFIERRKSSITDFKEAATGRGEKIKSGIMERARRVKDKSSQLSEQVRHKTSDTASHVKEGLSDWRESASEYGQSLRERASHSSEGSRSGFYKSVQNHPLAIAGVLLAAGAVAGLLIPESRYEERKLGPARDRMLDQAREKGQETLRKAESVAHEAVESAKDEADKQGLIRRDQADQAEEKVRSSVGQAQEKVRSSAKQVRDQANTSAKQWSEEVEKF
jgi:gas vesicle protein